MIVSVSALPLLALALNFQLVAQAPQSPRADAGKRPSGVPATITLPTDTSATALRAQNNVVIDAKDADEVWVNAPPITAFQEWRPNEGKPARFKTEAKISYDASNLYV